jgi:2-polyprenyl-3-methyl-5-hydroxy-6-metoxy-1,4-benzoquinol methylase
LHKILGGYDDGYTALPCFWGKAPGSLVRTFLNARDVRGFHVLDIGAGEGRNAAAFARRGASVDAVECSTAAIANGRIAFHEADVNWIQADVLTLDFPRESYDVVVNYGLIHCLHSEDGALRVLLNSKAAAKRGGAYILVAFNNGSHDLNAHPMLKPLLMGHAWFLEAFADWEIVSATDTVLYETHPHNGIPHHHSLTRLAARRR